MKRKTLLSLTTGIFSFAAIALAGSLVIGSNGGLQTFLARGDQAGGTYTLTASDFTATNGDITGKNGENWHYTGASVEDGVVTITGGMYTTRRSGSYAENGRRGDGYTRFTIADLDTSSASGLVYHLFNADWVLKHGGNALTADNNLTSFPAAERRGMEIVQAAKSAFSFTSMTFYYDCVDVTPEVEITNTEVQVGVGETANLTTTKSDVYAGDTVSYAWESDDTDTLTVVGDGANATITGVAAGTATVTVTMTVNGKDYTDSIEVTVTAAAATVVPLNLGDGCRIEGAGIFVWFDTTSTGKTANQMGAFSLEITANGLTGNAVNRYNLQDYSGNRFCAYTVMDNANGLNGTFTLTYDFKDNANNTIYRAVVHWDNGKVDTEIHLAASAFSVEVGADLEVTASKASWLEGNATFAFASSNDTVFTVTANGNVATVRGVAEGSANLVVTMTIGDDEYTMSKQIAVSAAGVEHLITWYTEGTENQRNHWEGAGVWTWVDYGALGYDGFGAFSAQKDNMTVTCNKTSISIQVISDDIASIHVCRVYLSAGAAETTSVISMTIPDVNGVTYTGSITFVNGEATAYNA